MRGAGLLAALALLTAGSAAADPLAAKAQRFREAMYARHVSPEGLLLYRVDLRRIEEQLASGAYPDSADVPTFTGLWAGSACARAASTRGAERERALEDARRALDGMELLMRVTGVEGLMARCARRGPVPEPTGKRRWFPGGPGHQGWAWRGDVSHDQYANGLLPAVGLCRELFPERARALILAAARGLLAREMRLVDPDGRRTRYGDLGPRSGWGFNGIAMLAGWGIMALAAELDGDPRLASARDELRDRHRVVSRGVRRTNLRVLGVTNHSNDLMTFDLLRVLIPLARRTGDVALEDLMDGLDRVARRVRGDHNAYFALVECELRGACDPATLEWVGQMLRAFPDGKRKLPRPGLEELPRRWLPGRKWKPLARDPVPIEMRPVVSFEWKSSPYRVAQRVAPDTEYTGLDFLVAWWLFEALGG